MSEAIVASDALTPWSPNDCSPNCRRRAAGRHQGYDERHLNHRHGERQDQRAKRLTNPMRDDLRMMDGRQHAGDQANPKQPAAVSPCGGDTTIVFG